MLAHVLKSGSVFAQNDSIEYAYNEKSELTNAVAARMKGQRGAILAKGSVPASLEQTFGKENYMALHDSALRRSIHSIIQYLVLIVAQVLVAAIMTMIANKFDVRYLGHVTILFWIVLSILFCSVSPVEIVARLFLAFLSFFVSVGVYSILLLLYKTSS